MVFACRVWQVYSLPCLVPITAGCVLLVGSSADMVLPQDLLEVSGPQVLGSSVILFGYPAGSEDALIAGRLLMRFCDVCFAEKSHLGVAQGRKGC